MPESAHFMETVDSADLVTTETWSEQEQVIARIVVGVCRTLDKYQGRRRRVAQTDATLLSSGRALLAQLTDSIDETMRNTAQRRKSQNK